MLPLNPKSHSTCSQHNKYWFMFRFLTFPTLQWRNYITTLIFECYIDNTTLWKNPPSVATAQWLLRCRDVAGFWNVSCIWYKTSLFYMYNPVFQLCVDIESSIRLCLNAVFLCTHFSPLSIVRQKRISWTSSNGRNTDYSWTDLVQYGASISYLPMIGKETAQFS